MRMVRVGSVAALGLAIAGVGCGSSKQVVLPSQGGTATATQTSSRDQVAAQADGNVSGTVASFEGGRLTVTPYDGGAAGNAIEVPSTVPVWQGNGTVTTRALMPGVDVQVYFDESAGTRRAVGVQVLDEEAAQAAKQQAGQVDEVAGAQPIDDAVRRDTNVAPEYLERADGNQPGKVKEVAGSELVIDPYQKVAGDARLQLPTNVPVFQAEGRVTSKALKPGVDVRVFFRHQSGERPQVVAIEILDPENATKVREEIEDAPRGN